jgi:hypothetical protein
MRNVVYAKSDRPLWMCVVDAIFNLFIFWVIAIFALLGFGIAINLFFAFLRWLGVPVK